ncbi:UNKNOWN [Stylonychia lemnae]|uniref:RING-type domain-containing protein n=1 Tax=Stylonychia lemnae TaxID=5949 RepID=A0A078B0R9_STYLE|nr:UNKNOWN [Stylonychia lemnae]|eukprot:CDW88149.1 UNKNOWN [Stylonychia lemnae]
MNSCQKSELLVYFLFDLAIFTKTSVTWDQVNREIPRKTRVQIVYFGILMPLCIFLAVIAFFFMSSEQNSCITGEFIVVLFIGLIRMLYFILIALKTMQINRLERDYLNQQRSVFDEESPSVPGLNAQQLMRVKPNMADLSRSIKDDEVCPICQMELKDLTIITQIPECKHMFHVNCIAEWLRRKAICPCCNRNLSTIFDQRTTADLDSFIVPDNYDNNQHLQQNAHVSISNVNLENNNNNENQNHSYSGNNIHEDQNQII